MPCSSATPDRQLAPTIHHCTFGTLGASGNNISSKGHHPNEFTTIRSTRAPCINQPPPTGRYLKAAQHAQHPGRAPVASRRSVRRIRVHISHLRPCPFPNSRLNLFSPPLSELPFHPIALSVVIRRLCGLGRRDGSLTPLTRMARIKLLEDGRPRLLPYGMMRLIQSWTPRLTPGSLVVRQPDPCIGTAMLPVPARTPAPIVAMYISRKCVAL